MDKFSNWICFSFPDTRVPNISHESTMEEQRKRDLNLLQLQRVQDIDIDQVLASFIQKNSRKMFARSTLSDWKRFGVIR